MAQMNEQEIVSKLNELDAKESALRQIKSDCDKRIEECKVARKGVENDYVRTHRLFKNGEVVRYKNSPRGRENLLTLVRKHMFAPNLVITINND